MNNKVKSAIKFILIIAFMLFLLWYVFDTTDLYPHDDSKTGTLGEKISFIYKEWLGANKWWLFLSAVLAIVSHVQRAERWRMQLKPIGYNVSLWNAFLATMNAYFVNLAIPRGGEVSRPVMLKRLEGVPTATSIGTIVAERIIDLFFLLILIGVVFVFQVTRLSAFFKDYLEKNPGKEEDGIMLYVILGGVAAILIAVVIFIINKALFDKVRIKIKDLSLQAKEGVVSIKKLENNGLFIFHSFSIWILYYIMLYTGLLAYEPTSHLGPFDALTIFVVGGIAMAMPFPGGTGSFHLLIPAALIHLCGIQDAGGKITIAFTILYHEFHTLVVLVTGGIALMFSQQGTNKKKIANGSSENSKPITG